MRKLISFLIVSLLMIGCTEKIDLPMAPVVEKPVIDTNSIPVINDYVAKTDFHVSGKLIDNNNKPIVGVKATLSKSGLYAITDSKGAYLITGKVNGLKKILSSDSAQVEDTLVVTLPNGSNSTDSSEVIRTVVRSGVLLDLPATYIVQREIRGYLTMNNIDKVGRVEAILYDLSVPDIQKKINLWNDTLNKAFHAFAYFSSVQNKTYNLYVNIFDKNDKFISRSPNFEFPDNAGNIIFSKPFDVGNAKPVIAVKYSGYANRLLTQQSFTYNKGTPIDINISAKDTISLIGNSKIVGVYLDKGNNDFVKIDGVLAKKIGDSTIITCKVNTDSLKTDSLYTLYILKVKAIDNEGNETVSEQKIVIVDVNANVQKVITYKGTLNCSVKRLEVGVPATFTLEVKKYVDGVIDNSFSDSKEITSVKYSIDRGAEVITNQLTCIYTLSQTPTLDMCTFVFSYYANNKWYTVSKGIEMNTNISISRSRDGNK